MPKITRMPTKLVDFGSTSPESSGLSSMLRQTLGCSSLNLLALRLKALFTQLLKLVSPDIIEAELEDLDAQIAFLEKRARRDLSEASELKFRRALLRRQQGE